jgi:hypothetical protein
MRYFLVGVSVLSTAVSLAACSDFSGTGGCPPVALVPAVQVEVRSATSGAALASGSTGVVRDGVYADSLRPSAWHGDTLVSLGAAPNRPGTYDVTVEHPGYSSWHESAVEVVANACGIGRPVHLEARLEPEP